MRPCADCDCWGPTPSARAAGVSTPSIRSGAAPAAAAPIAEEDTRALTATIPHTTSGRVLSLLEERGLLTPATSRATSADQRWVEEHIAQLPEPINDELRIWVKVMRGDGRRRRRIRSWAVIRNYLYTTLPTLREWSTRHTSLREVTEADARAAIQKATGTTAQTQRTGLRSIFTALKQERVVFRDPTRGIVLSKVDNLPTGLRDDQLRGLIDRADGALQRLVVALVAIHAIGPKELRALTVDGVDTARGTLEVRRRGRVHTVYLDEFTLRLMLDWLRQRRGRWPDTINPHLLISSHGAFALDMPPVGSATIARIFHELGLQPRHVRSDRLLHEATITEDPLHLMRVFGVSAATAMRYLHAAHPERGAVPLTDRPTRATMIAASGRTRLGQLLGRGGHARREIPVAGSACPHVGHPHRCRYHLASSLRWQPVRLTDQHARHLGDFVTSSPLLVLLVA
jgi:hypothetical protein